MARAGLELAGIDVLGELEEGPGVLAEIADVEHGLGIGKIGEIHRQTGIDAVAGTEIGDAAGDGHAGPRQHYHVLGTWRRKEETLLHKQIENRRYTTFYHLHISNFIECRIFVAKCENVQLKLVLEL